jgi:recombination protein RecT
MSYNRLIAQVRVEVTKNPKILECTQLSVVESICRIQQWGLQIGVDAYLVPYGQTCTPVADYKGLAALMVASRAVRAVQARPVYANEAFSYEYGLNEQLVHRPIHDPAKRGALMGAYCILRLPGGRDVFEFMSIEDIEAIRANSKQWGPKKVPVCPPWYAKKTIIRQVAKLVPKNPKFERVLEVIDDELAGGRTDDETADWTVDDAEPAVVDRAPVAAAPAAPLRSGGRDDHAWMAPEEPAASDAQIARILALCEHTALDETKLAAQIRARIKNPLTGTRAHEIIIGLEAEIAKVTPAPLSTPAAKESSVAELQAAADRATIEALSARYKELITSDRVLPKLQTEIRERLAQSELTVDVLRAAIAVLEDAEIPF